MEDKSNAFFFKEGERNYYGFSKLYTVLRTKDGEGVLKLLGKEKMPGNLFQVHYVVLDRTIPVYNDDGFPTEVHVHREWVLDLTSAEMPYRTHYDLDELVENVLNGEILYNYSMNEDLPIPLMKAFLKEYTYDASSGTFELIDKQFKEVCHNMGFIPSTTCYNSSYFFNEDNGQLLKLDVVNDSVVMAVEQDEWKLSVSVKKEPIDLSATQVRGHELLGNFNNSFTNKWRHCFQVSMRNPSVDEGNTVHWDYYLTDEHYKMFMGKKGMIHFIKRLSKIVKNNAFNYGALNSMFTSASNIYDVKFIKLPV